MYLRLSLLVLFSLHSVVALHCQSYNQITGSVHDKEKEPLIGVNVYIDKSIEGDMTDSEGNFKFYTSRNETDTVILVIKYLGYKDYRITSEISHLKDLNIILELEGISISEVTVIANNFNFSMDPNQKNKMNALDIVMSGSSNGDIFGALQSLPGTQKVGENGRLYVRGGESEESQIFINGMHVLVPYTTNPVNTVQRSRFSPFLFKGINLNLGGYSSEYGQALSSVLPMQTTDISTEDKLGVSISPLSLNIGGTISKKRDSFSFNGDYMNLGLYNKVFPDKYDWINPYQKISGESQYKMEFNSNNILKAYVGYDYTTFKQNISETFNVSNIRDLALKEHNIYINTTYQSTFNNGYSMFLGAANSIVRSRINNALVRPDYYKNDRDETHLKASVKKRFSENFLTSLGAESYLRRSVQDYHSEIEDKQNKYDLQYNIYSIYSDNQIKLSQYFFLNLSGRIEYQTSNREWSILPRTSLSYIPNRNIQLSTSYGSYTQSTKDDILASNIKELKQELADHLILSFAYQNTGATFRLETYYKKYRKLPLLNNDVYSSNGYGHSKGIDLFFEKNNLLKNLTSTIAYSYNDNKRLYLDYPVLSEPQYSTVHNLNISLRYHIPRVKTYIGVSNLFASGRPYHNPNEMGFMNSRTTPYNSLDMNLTFLLKPSIILYTSLTNLLGKTNVFNYNYSTTKGDDNNYRAVPTVGSRERFFYIGVFISINNTKAYEISNF